MNLTLSYDHVQLLVETLDKLVKDNEYETDDIPRILYKLEDALEDEWRPGCILPPLSIHFMVRMVGSSKESVVARVGLADSYSPSTLRIFIDGKEAVVDTADFYWRYL